MIITTKTLKRLIRQALNEIEFKDIVQNDARNGPNAPVDDTDTSVLDAAKDMADHPIDYELEELEYMRKVLLSRAEKLRRIIDGEKEAYPGAGRKPKGKTGPYSRARQNMLKYAKDIKSGHDDYK